jgi:hypothetical protein
MFTSRGIVGASRKSAGLENRQIGLFRAPPNEENTYMNARKLYIDILSDFAKNATPEPDAPDEKRISTLSGELIDAGHLTGGTMRDVHGEIRGAVVTGMTVQGRLFLDELRRKEKEESWWGKFKTWGFPIIGALVGYIVAVVTPVLTEWLKTFLPAHHP